MKNLLLTMLACLAVTSLHARDVQKRVDSLADFYHQTFDFNGSILVTQKGKVLLNKGYGYRDHAKGAINTENSVYLIGSITKQFTAEIILMLEKEGKLSVKDKLSKYYPDYKYGDSITLHHLLTHTSGIFDYTRDSTWGDDVEQPMSDEKIFAYFWNRPLNFSPGSKWSYSNSGYKLLGNIIEKATGKSYYANVRERIFIPLGMTHSGFDYTYLVSKDKTVGYFGVRNDSFMVAPIVDSTHTNAAGSIYSTTGDLLKWHNALQSYKLLPREWQDKAYVPFKKGYAYGWEADSIAGKYVLSHSGHIHGYNSNFYHMPNEDVSIIIFTNFMKTGADPIAYAANMVNAMYDDTYAVPAPRKAISLAENIKSRYTGDYIFTEDSSLHFTFSIKDKNLYVQLTGQPKLPLLPQSETMFFTKVVDAQIEFKKDEDGAYYVVLHQNGQALQAKKKKS